MTFSYQAFDKEGVIVQGFHEADNDQMVIEYLQKRNLVPIFVNVQGAAKKSLNLKFALFESIQPVDRILLVRNLGATLKAGLSISEALEILISDSSKKVMRDILVEAKTNVENGQPLSVTFANHPKEFSAFFVGIIKAGEVSGKLSESLDELSRYLSREYDLVRKIKTALAYPIILLVASTGIVVLLLIFILPRLQKTFEQSGVELPLITRIVTKASSILAYSPLLDIAIIVAIVWMFTYFRRTETGRRFFTIVGYKIPVVKELLKKIALVRFARTLGSLIASGTSILDALRLAGNSAGNHYYRKAIEETIVQVSHGNPVSKGMEKHPELFPHFLTSLTVVGERTGTLETVLKTYADFNDEEVDNTLRSLTTFIEPVLLLFMGLIIGSVALSVLLPIYQLVGNFV